MKDCCLAIITTYRDAWGSDGPEGTALYCPASDTRIVYQDGHWATEAPR